MPLNLILDGRPVLVVGGGQVGHRKVMSLLDGGASVELVCPDAVDALAELAAAVVVVALQVWKRNPLVSILAGTAVYMTLVQTVVP